jgi:hypothetical protein
MRKVEGNYSSCTSMSSENLCSSSGDAQGKGKRGGGVQNSMKLKGIIVVVQVGAVKIYVAACLTFQRRERTCQVCHH